MRFYIARQAIYDKAGNIRAYELLYRNSEKNAFDPSVDPDQATYKLLNQVVTTFDLMTVTDSKLAFINFTEKLIRDEMPRVLNSAQVVVEVLETVPVNQENIDAVIKLKEAGYKIAMDDYTGDPVYDPVLPLADIVKVDFGLVKGQDRLRLVEKVWREDLQILAEKVETEEDYKLAVSMGYNLFQGYYFDKPAIMQKESVGASYGTQVRVLRELDSPTASLQRLEEIIRLDANLSYKLLCRANTLRYYRGTRVKDIRSALMRLGMGELRRWVLLMFYSGTVSKSEENIIRLSLARALFCEKIGADLGGRKLSKDAFTMGMFSMLDVLYNEYMDRLLEDISINQEVEAALRGQDCRLRRILDFVIAYENGKWDEAESILGREADMSKATDYYYEAIQYSNDIYKEQYEINQKRS